MSHTISKVGVCGAGGTMGAGIAIVAARAGFGTISFDVGQDRLDAARAQTSAFFCKSVERGKLAADERDAIMARSETTTDLAKLGECDLVIEAVFEDLQVKRKLLGQLDAVCAPGT